MTPTEVQSVLKAIGTLWPRLLGPKGWTRDEQALFAEKAGRVNCSAEQAIAAIREYKSTEEGYPKLAGMLKRLKMLNPTGTISPRPSDNPNGEPAAIVNMRRVLSARGHIVPGGPADVVWNYHAYACQTDVECFGHVPEDRFDNLKADLVNHCGYDVATAEACQGHLIERWAHKLTPIPERERTPKQRWMWRMKDRRPSPAAMEAAVVVDARRDVRNEKRRDEVAVVNRRAEVAGWAGGER